MRYILLLLALAGIGLLVWLLQAEARDEGDEPARPSASGASPGDERAERDPNASATALRLRCLVVADDAAAEVPLAGAAVLARAGKQRGQAQTDAAGRAALTLSGSFAAESTGTVRVSRLGFVPRERTFPVAVDSSAASGGEREIKVRLQRATGAFGRVEDRFGKPVVGATVTLVDKNPDRVVTHPDPTPKTTSEVDGSYALNVADTAALDLGAVAPGYLSTLLEDVAVVGGAQLPTLVLTKSRTVRVRISGGGANTSVLVTKSEAQVPPGNAVGLAAAPLGRARIAAGQHGGRPTVRPDEFDVDAPLGPVDVVAVRPGYITIPGVGTRKGVEADFVELTLVPASVLHVDFLDADTSRPLHVFPRIGVTLVHKGSELILGPGYGYQKDIAFDGGFRVPAGQPLALRVRQVGYETLDVTLTADQVAESDRLKKKVALPLRRSKGFGAFAVRVPSEVTGLMLAIGRPVGGGKVWERVAPLHEGDRIFLGVPLGRHAITFLNWDHGSATGVVEVSATEIEAAQRSAMELTLQEGAPLTVQATDEAGSFLEDVSIALRGPSGPADVVFFSDNPWDTGGGHLLRVRQAGDGLLSNRIGLARAATTVNGLPPGRYSLRASCVGFADVETAFTVDPQQEAVRVRLVFRR